MALHVNSLDETYWNEFKHQDQMICSCKLMIVNL